MEQNDIEPEIISLILQRKYFYGHFLQQFKRVMVDNDSPMAKTIKTAGVSITSDLRPNLYINRSFYNSLSQDQRIAVLEHEILHLLSAHLIRIEGRNSYVWNLAADLAINQYIKGLPEGAMCGECNIFIPLQHGGFFPISCPQCNKGLDKDKDICQPLYVKSFKVDGQLINLPREKPTETYYDILWEKMPKMTIQCGTSLTKQQGQTAKGNLGDEQQEGEEQGGEQSGSSDKQGIPMPLDDHATWETGADNNEMAHEKIKDMVRKAIAKTDERSQGYLPAYLKALIDVCIAHKTLNWKSELRRFVGYEEFAKYIPTRKKLNKRFQFMMGYKVQRKACILVAKDSSGSVGDDEFAKMDREEDMMVSAGITVIDVECDADIQKVEERRHSGKKGKIERIGYGGTDFRPVFNLVKNKTYKNHNGKVFTLKKKIDGVVYLTDGAGTYPNAITCPTIWVLTPNNWSHGWSEKLGKKIEMKD